MSIPFATTTIDVLEDVKPSDEDVTRPAPRIVFRAVPANIQSPSGAEVRAGVAQQMTLALSMSCDPIDLKHRHRVRDNSTGEIYDVVWVRTRNESGLLGRTRAGLTVTRGGV